MFRVAVRNALLEKIKEAGFEIAMVKEMTITKEMAEDFYKEHAFVKHNTQSNIRPIMFCILCFDLFRDKSYFDDLTTLMSSGPLLALCLAREDAVQGWREMLGPPSLEEAREQAPESLRAQFGVEGININMIHGADSPEAAQQEIDYFFPVQKTVAVIKPEAYENKGELYSVYTPRLCVLT